MKRVMLLSLVALFSTVLLSGCQTSIDDAEKKEKDLVTVAEDEKPTPEDLVNTTVTLAMLPTQMLATGLPGGVEAAVYNKVGEALRDHANVALVAESEMRSRLVDMSLEGSSAMYSSENAVEIGKLANAQFIAWVEIVRWNSSLRAYQVELTGDDGKPYLENRWDLGGEADVSVKVLNVETGKYEASDTQVGSVMQTYEVQPNEATQQYIARQAIERAASNAVRKATRLNPYKGYILETLENRELAKCRFDCETPPAVGTLVYAYRLLGMKEDPVTNQLYRDEKRVAKLVVERVDSKDAVWCRTQSGEDRMLAGMYVRTAGLLND